MDSSSITPFVQSTSNVFEMMLQLPVTVGKPELKKEPEPAHDVSGIIGLSGDIEGLVVVSFPTSTAERAVSLFTGETLEATNPDFADAIGELVNMISGGAKAQFEGKSIQISVPSVVVGTGHTVFGKKDMKGVTIPCSCDIGEFSVEVSMVEWVNATAA
ncbi:chemotaxis protein CheX [Mucisphaera calidilacus]|uniref:CheY-P phosphatase CheX n=1 Tax=Mucisphaera calidilacus TaxID=2527982 RepID=A0A518C0M0_9BACT|nr:chemotaxis protein CheX [Mucisphaera calidilacus]QDU72747.1 CheY-P phosphatase CheX [Mucisphaera calidilacus]